MNYNIKWLEKKQSSNGKPYLKATITGPNGDEDVTIWSEFPNFANLMPGADVVGEVKVNGKYKNLVYPKPTTTNGPGRSAYMEKVVEKKQEGIRVAQENKEEGIKLSSTIRMAVDLAIAECGSSNDHETYSRRIQYWRKWLWQEWDKPLKGENVNYVPDYPPPVDDWQGM